MIIGPSPIIPELIELAPLLDENVEIILDNPGDRYLRVDKELHRLFGDRVARLDRAWEVGAISTFELAMGLLELCALADDATI